MISGRALFLDTWFVLALLNADDEHHAQALGRLADIEAAMDVVVSEAVLTEIANALADHNRQAAFRFIRHCYDADNISVVPVDTALFQRGLERYGARPDKSWGLTDCISFVIMEDRGLTRVATRDRHFEQAGFVRMFS
ncbi:MAG TPA: PIN domain-containing protein [Gemmatimonadaceae bacterium]